MMKSNVLLIYLMMVTGFGTAMGAEGGLAAKGKSLVESKPCAACHKKGGFATPLEMLAKVKTDDQLKQALTNPKKALGPETMMPAYKFTNEELQAVVDYLRSISQTK